MNGKHWLVWSNEHGGIGWLRPHEVGYTSIIENAGRYTLKRAVELCELRNQHQNQTLGMKIKNRVLVLSPEKAKELAESAASAAACAGVKI